LARGAGIEIADGMSINLYVKIKLVRGNRAIAFDV